MAPDIHRYGLTQVYKPPEGTACVVDIFFIHGLFGHPKDTWTRLVRPARSLDDSGSSAPSKKKMRWSFHPGDQEVFWPYDLLPQLLPQARIFTWGYDVKVQNLFSSVSKATVFQHAETLLMDIATLRSPTADTKRPIIFIAHSLGGIVVKEALSLSRTESTFLKNVLPATAGVCFLGTPHRGSKTASVGKIAYGMSRVLAAQDPNMNILRALEVQSEVLERVGRTFSQILAEGKLKVHSFREELKTKGTMVVDAFSATLDHPAESRGSIHANHRENGEGDNSEPEESMQLSHFGYSGYRQNLATIGDEQLVKATLDRHETRERFRMIGEQFEDTYTWLFEERVQFESWLSGDIQSPLYWISGKPGSGKSTIMKLALEHPMTRHHLLRYSSSYWVMAGFFFHDRGFGLQKSFEGFLRGILHQILSQRTNFVRPLLEAEASSLVFTEKDGAISFSINWTREIMEKALLWIASKQELNLCLFIDALDEHDGNHQPLLSFILRLANIDDGARFKARICLASRPENIFAHTFRDAPGFAIHDFTHDDIDKFTRNGMKEIADDSPTGFTDLVEQVLSRARGVFMWVKLVISELMDGWIRGDTVEELQETLSEIPNELQDLYRRALQRGRLKNTRSVTRDRLEAFIMFQIVNYNPPPLSMGKFTKLIQYNIVGDSFRDGQFTDSQMRRRINDRSSGLLEVVQDSLERTAVQFIHQTTREYFVSDQGYCDLYSDTNSRPVETGMIYFIRATLWLRALDESFYAPEIMVIEEKHGLPAISQLNIGYIRQFLGSKSIKWPIPSGFVKAVLESEHVGLAKCFLSLFFNFEISLEETLAHKSSFPNESGGLLLRTATALFVAKLPGPWPSQATSALRCLKVLLRSGIQISETFEDRTCLTDLDESELPEVDKTNVSKAIGRTLHELDEECRKPDSPYVVNIQLTSSISFMAEKTRALLERKEGTQKG
ncbi:hypothetical protein BR93DRAFT_970192 [Coniochaeta sp. PMI_546]|nr:hypothetical protein BR93DRAFT_970192 [Coniochaeta sp. PMI_546]